MQAKIIPVILCGGSGKRLLPFLRYDSPKQFLDIFNSSKNLFQETILRFTNESFFSNPIVIWNISHKNELQRSINEVGVQLEAMIFEQDGKNTGPAVSSVVAYLQEAGISNDTLFLVVPIDHYIGNKNVFVDRVLEAVKVIRNTNKIFTFSVKKTTSENNYGHLRVGVEIENLNGFFEVIDFIEKPENDICDVVWNSGIYCMSIDSFQKMMLNNAPHILHYSRLAMLESVQRKTMSLMKNEVILNNEHFKKNQSLSFDQILTMPYETNSLICSDIGTEWEDIGLWSGITRLYSRNQRVAKSINTEVFACRI